MPLRLSAACEFYRHFGVVFVYDFVSVGLTVEYSVGGAGPLLVVVPTLGSGPELVAPVVHPTAVWIQTRFR